MTLERYDVVIRNKTDGNCRELPWQVESFAEAEERTIPLVEDDEEIIGIEKDYHVPYKAYSN